MDACLKVLFSLEAVYDMAEIAEYIEERFGKSRADRFSAELDETVTKLSYSHGSHGDAGFTYRGEKIRKLIFGPSIVFYSVDQAHGVIYVLRILRHERDWQKTFREPTEFTFDA